jgi:hypothetical protein
MLTERYFDDLKSQRFERDLYLCTAFLLQGEQITVWANELTSRDSALAFDHRHYDFCQFSPETRPKDPPTNLGQRLFGDRLEPIPYEVKMLTPVSCKEVRFAGCRGCLRRKSAVSFQS